MLCVPLLEQPQQTASDSRMFVSNQNHISMCLPLMRVPSGPRRACLEMVVSHYAGSYAKNRTREYACKYLCCSD
jgi:hypothetical protein